MDIETSNVGPIAILTSYLALAATLTYSIINSIATRHTQTAKSKPTNRKERKDVIALFSILAIGSLGITWFYMFSFFAQSYSDWALIQAARRFEGISGAGNIDLGSWLRDSKLFKEAWGVAMESRARWWWTQQIFSWTTFWSFWVGVEGYRHKIHSPYKFMLLGQIVAISFATNLFFLAVLVSPPTSPSTSASECGFKTTDEHPGADTKDTSSHSTSQSAPTNSLPIKETTLAEKPKKGKGDSLTSFLCLQFLILPGLGSAAVLPTLLGTPSFMPTLLIPHLLLFVPPLLAYFEPDSSFCRAIIEGITRKKEKLYTAIVVASIVLFGWSTYSAVTEEGGNGWGGIQRALYSHPAVSSVGWDVICCWVSWGMWSLFGPDSE